MRVIGEVAGARHVRDRFNALARSQTPGDLCRLAFAHPERDHVLTAGFGNARQHRILPVIVMRKPAQRGLQPAQNHRQLGIRPLCQLRIYRGAAIRAFARYAAGGVFVPLAAPFCHGVMGHHTVHVAAADEKTVARTAEFPHALAGGIVRLRQHAHTVALAFQHARNDGRAKAWMINICIPRYQHKIHCVPAAPQHLRAVEGQKFSHSGLLLSIHLIDPHHLLHVARRYSPSVSSGWRIVISIHCSRVISTWRGFAPS